MGSMGVEREGMAEAEAVAEVWLCGIHFFSGAIARSSFTTCSQRQGERMKPGAVLSVRKICVPMTSNSLMNLTRDVHWVCCR